MLELVNPKQRPVIGYKSAMRSQKACHASQLIWESLAVEPAKLLILWRVNTNMYLTGTGCTLLLRGFRNAHCIVYPKLYTKSVQQTQVSSTIAGMTDLYFLTTTTK